MNSLNQDLQRLDLHKEELNIKKPFKEKKWTNVWDNTFQDGEGSRQLHYNLDALSSNDWCDLSQATVDIPMFFGIKLKRCDDGTTVSINHDNVGILPYINVVESVSLQIDSYQVKNASSNQNFISNCIMNSTWSRNFYKKNAPLYNHYMDWDEEDFKRDWDQFDTRDENNGFKKRCRKVLFLNDSLKSTDNPANLTTNNLFDDYTDEWNQFDAVAKIANSSTVGKYVYEQLFIAKIRLVDIIPALKDFGLMKNIKGHLYINLNQGGGDILWNSGKTIQNVTYSAISGITNPVQISLSTSTYLGTNPTGADFSYECIARSKGREILDKPIMNASRLNVPYYTPNPEFEAQLAIQKTIRYPEIFTRSPITVKAGENYSGLISSGVNNARFLVMIPFINNNEENAIKHPYQDPRYSAPHTTSSYCLLTQLQVYYGNKPVYNDPVNFSFDAFEREYMNFCSYMGGNDEIFQNGLISYEQFRDTYRYYIVDLNRQGNDEDGNLKSIQVSFKNSMKKEIELQCFVLFEKQITIDTQLGKIRDN
jgi:hypothetical protein